MTDELPLPAGDPPAGRRGPAAAEAPASSTHDSAESRPDQVPPEPPSTVPPPAAAAGTLTVPGYEILGELGRGGMGVVYKARDLRLKRLVALKVIKAGELADAEARTRFRLEAEAVARMQHPHIVQIHDVGEADGRPFFTLELVEGGSLAAKLGHTPQPPREAALLLEVLARAMQAVHERGIIHRDLKPGNVLLAADGTPKITDFGLARAIVADQSLTGTGGAAGTPEYMAPEQAWGGTAVEPLGPACDVWALGVILYEMLTGSVPFRGASAYDTLFQVCSQEPVAPSHVQPKVPRDLETICLKCLEKQARRRYASAGALADELRRFLDGRPIHARPVGRVGRLTRWCRRNPVVAGLIGAVAVSLVVGTTVAWALALEAAAGEREAQTQKQRADEKAGEAAQREKAEREQRGKAERATADALVKADALDKANRKLETALAFSLVGSARREWLAANVRVAEQLLDACNPAFREWEWRYLKRQCHTDLDYPGKGEIFGHPLAVSPKGNVLATQFLGEQVTVWRVLRLKDRPLVRSDRYPLGTDAFPTRLNRFVDGLSFSADGRRLAAAWKSYDPSFKARDGVKVWDITDKKTLLYLDAERPTAIALRPDGRRLALIGDHGTVQVWDVDTTRFVRALGAPKAKLLGVAFSPDGKQLAVGTGDGRIQIREAETGKEVFALTDAGVPRHLVFSADGKRLAASDMNQARSWSLTAEPKQAAVCHGHTEQVMAVALSPDGRLLATGSNDKTVKVWDARYGFLDRTYRGHNDLVWSVAFSADGKRLISGDRSGIIKVWDLTSPQESRWCLGHRSFAHRAAFSPDGKRVASTSDDATVKIWEARTGKELFSFAGHDSATVGVAFSPDGKRVASGSDRRGPGLGDVQGEVLVWDADSGKVGLTLRGNTGRVHALAFSRDGRLLASAGAGNVQPRKAGEVIVWDANDGRRLHTLGGHTEEVTAVAFHPDGKRLASADSLGTVRLWDAATGQRFLALERAGSCLAFSRDGKYLATGGKDERRGATLQVRDAATGAVLFTLKGHAREVTAVSFSPDGKRLASASMDKTVRLWWDPLNRQEVLTLPHTDFARDVAFSPDGDLLASVCWAQVQIWDATPLPVEKKRGPAPR